MVDMPNISKIREKQQIKQPYQVEYMPQIQAQAFNQRQMATMDNPFAVERYQNVPMPDVPVSYGGTMADSMLNDNEVPEAIKKKILVCFP